MSGRLSILSGPPGAGKTTLARRLAVTASGPAAHLEIDHFFNAIRSGFIAPWLSQSRDQNLAVNRAAAAASCALGAGGYHVFIDGVVGPWFTDLFRDAAAAAKLPLDYVALRPSRDQAVTRARDRAEGPLPDYPPNIFEGLSDLGDLERHVLVLGEATTDDLAARLAADLPRDLYRL